MTKQSSQAGAITYGYDGSGRVATYTNTYSSNSQSIVESYSFTSGILSGGTITVGTASLTVAAANGRIANITFPSGSRYRYTYDTNGYLTREDELDATSVVESYTTYEYGTTTYQSANVPTINAPAVNLYGNTSLPVIRQASYTSNGTLSLEYRTQYQVNGKGFLTGITQDENDPSTGKYTTTVTYNYSNCQ